jgi:hypothetical protein
MEAAPAIRAAMERVTQLRQQCAADPALAKARSEVKRLQARRFAGSYAEMLEGGPYQNAARFFLEELYGEQDFTERDAQFSRIAMALQRIFPAQVVQTAVSLGELHALSEELDLAMARRWRAQKSGKDTGDDARRYLASWRGIGHRSDRFLQVHTVLAIGRELDRLVRLPGLRMMLKMMRKPASLAGLSALQHFLELGFDTFADMGRHKGQGASEFLAIIEARETALVEQLFDEEPAACEDRLRQILGKAR